MKQKYHIPTIYKFLLIFQPFYRSMLVSFYLGKCTVQKLEIHTFSQFKQWSCYINGRL